MHIPQEIIVMALILAAFGSGAGFGTASAYEDIKGNTVNGYHCTPITKHIGLGSAKKQVKAYQAMVRG